MPKLKLRLPTEETKKPETVGNRPLDLLLELDTTEVAKTITQEELMDVIDYACLLDQRIKGETAELDKMKKALRAVAKEQGWKTKESKLGKVKIDPSTSLIVDPRALADLARKMGKTSLFMDLVTVKMTEATRYLGREVLEGIGTKSEEEFGRMTLKVK